MKRRTALAHAPKKHWLQEELFGPRPILILYRRPPLVSAGDRAVHAAIRREQVKRLRSKAGEMYRVTMKWITQFALPRVEGTLGLPPKTHARTIPAILRRMREKEPA